MRTSIIVIVCIAFILISALVIIFGFYIYRKIGPPRADNPIEGLSSGNNAVVISSLCELAEKKDPIGREKAEKLLLNDNYNVYVNAALYLASINNNEITPYLVKGLKYAPLYTQGELVKYLEIISGMKLGRSYCRWLAWWKKENPDSNFDFSWQFYENEALRLRDSHSYSIRSVIDPVTINYEPNIILIGIKLKKDVADEKAMSLLRQLVIQQVVTLQFDNGPQLDDNGSRRAFVYWKREDNQDSTQREIEGLPPVPFKQKTLINAYLLKSGLYDYDPSSVYDEKMKQLLEDIPTDSKAPNEPAKDKPTDGK